jgi:hypothetical protein
MLGPAQHRFDEIAVIEIDRERHVGEIAGGEIKRRLRQIDAVIVADFGSSFDGSANGRYMPLLLWFY